MGNDKKTFFGEFKKFISRGNVLDMAVGLIVGTAFTKIVNSLVGDLLMPAIGWLIGGVDFSELKIVLAEATADTAETAIRYGAFIQAIIDFLLIAFSVYILVRVINNLRDMRKKKEAAEPPAPPEPSEEVKLLGEIRDLLKNE